MNKFFLAGHETPSSEFAVAALQKKNEEEINITKVLFSRYTKTHTDIVSEFQKIMLINFPQDERTNKRAVGKTFLISHPFLVVSSYIALRLELEFSHHHHQPVRTITQMKYKR